MRIDQRVHGWRAAGRISYAACQSDDFSIEFGQFADRWRGGCLITEINAVMFRGNQSIRARPYESSGTSYSHYEIVNESDDRFCIRRVGTTC